jgi:thiol-disulfide isomerase/thioredoxin
MNKIFFGLIILVLWQYRGKVEDLVVAKKVTSPHLLNSNCLLKEKCAVVYIAPWCPACLNIIPELKGILNNARIQSRFGFIVIVGQGLNPADNQSKVNEIGEGAFVDTFNEWSESLRVKKFPSFFVLDRSGSVVEEDRHAREWINKNFVPLL